MVEEYNRLKKEKNKRLFIMIIGMISFGLLLKLFVFTEGMGLQSAMLLVAVPIATAYYQPAAKAVKSWQEANPELYAEIKKKEEAAEVDDDESPY